MTNVLQVTWGEFQERQRSIGSGCGLNELFKWTWRKRFPIFHELPWNCCKAPLLLVSFAQGKVFLSLKVAAVQQQQQLVLCCSLLLLFACFCFLVWAQIRQTNWCLTGTQMASATFKATFYIHHFVSRESAATNSGQLLVARAAVLIFPTIWTRSSPITTLVSVQSSHKFRIN